MAELINKLDLLEVMALSHKAHANNSREASLLDRDLRIVLEQPTTTEAEIRAKAIDEAIEASAKEICVGCGYLDGYKCTYKGSNCGVSKPMLELVTEVLEKQKGGNV